ncbi:MAG: CRISPR system precrRNA processing endoribonuclease RAMP protein Cas6 [Anaerolineales bacterium]|nr:CRISPR system precrRNA processing endoribonuclease RAMP protein Cas6 [Anaerolineales bacterium]
MHTFTAHRLRFVAEAQSTIELNEHQGSAIRGALFHALRNRFCANQAAGECAACPLVAACPVAALVSTLNPEGERGRDVPRPFTVQPPLPGSGGRVSEAGDGRLFYCYAPGERLEFGLTLYAQALALFPYVILAVNEFERGGIGRRIEQASGAWQRGRLAIREVWAENPLTGARQPVLRAGEKLVHVPDIPITHQQVMDYAARITARSARLTLHVLTPMRIVEHGRLLKPEMFRFQPFFQRLLERLEALSRQFSDTSLRLQDARGVIEAAGHVRVVQNRLTWEELRSYSTRRRAESPTSGLLGEVTVEADDWAPFLPWVVWGQFVHVGKDAVKGNGLYSLEKGLEP